MSDLSNAIEDHVNRILGKQKLYGSVCKVVTVDDTNRTCEVEPINGDAERTGRLQTSLELAEGVYIKPSEGSYVLLQWINEITGIITQFSQIDEIDITIGGSSLNIIDGQVTFNGGALGGLAVPSKVRSRLNFIENDINSLKTAFSSWVVAPDGGAALKAAASTWYGSQLTLTQENDINNEDILQ